MTGRGGAELPALGLAALLWSAVAPVVGSAAYAAVPSQTKPSILGWLLPVSGLVAVGVAKARALN